MSSEITAHDLWPLVMKLTHGERLRLAKLALSAAATDDAAAYQAAPPAADEFAADDDPLAEDGEGWEEFSASR